MTSVELQTYSYWAQIRQIVSIVIQLGMQCTVSSLRAQQNATGTVVMKQYITNLTKRWNFAVLKV